AENALARVKQSLEGGLQFDAKADPQKKLREGVVGDNEGGFRAYEETPLQVGSVHVTFNLIAIIIVALITTVLVIGIRESASFNGIMVLVKLAAVLFVIFAGLGYVDASNWSPFLPFGMSGVLGAAGVIFFAYIGFDSVSTHAEEAKNPSRDVPIGILSSLAICTVLYIAVTLVITGMLPYTELAL